MLRATKAVGLSGASLPLPPLRCSGGPAAILRHPRWRRR